MAGVAEIVIGIVLLIIFISFLASSIRVCPEWMRFVKLRLGKYVGICGPGIVLIIPIIDRLIPVDLRISVIDLPAQKALTRDNVEITVDAAVYFRVVKPEDAVLNVENYRIAVGYLAASTLRDVIGMKNLDTALSKREEIAREIAKIIDEHVQTWGIKVSSVVIKDIRLPEGLVRAMAQAAEAERAGRAKVILAEADLEASKKYLQAALTYSQNPASLILRQIDAVIEVAREKNLILVVPSTFELTTLAPAVLKLAERRSSESERQ